MGLIGGECEDDSSACNFPRRQGTIHICPCDRRHWCGPYLSRKCGRSPGRLELDTSRQSAEHRCLRSGQVRRVPRAGKPRSLCTGTGDSAGGPLIRPKLSTHLPKAAARSSQFHRDERALAPAGSTLQRIGRRTCVEPTLRISLQKWAPRQRPCRRGRCSKARQGPG